MRGELERAITTPANLGKPCGLVWPASGYVESKKNTRRAKEARLGVSVTGDRVWRAPSQAVWRDKRRRS